MKKIKDNKGITLVALIVTIILMLILASVVTYNGIEAYKLAKVSEFVSQLQLVQAKVDEVVNAKSIEELSKLGEEVSKDEQINAINSAYSNGEVTSKDKKMYRYFTKENLLEIFEIDDSSEDVAINFSTREVVSIEGVKYDGSTYYTQYKLPNGQNIINNREEKDRTADFDTEILVDGLNAVVRVKNINITNGTLQFAEKVENEGSKIWETVTNYTEKEKTYDVNISKSGNYTFRIIDNTTSNELTQKEVKVTLTNKPKTNLSISNYNYGADSTYWAYVEYNGKYYVWVPRFVYNEKNDIKFIKGTSNITTDNIYVDSKWEVHEKFKRK